MMSDRYDSKLSLNHDSPEKILSMTKQRSQTIDIKITNKETQLKKIELNNLVIDNTHRPESARAGKIPSDMNTVNTLKREDNE